VLALCEPVAGKRVLDLGCGEGYCSRKLRRRGADVLGVDISDRMIGLAREAEGRDPLGIRYEVGDAVHLGFDDGSFDLVVGVFLFNYLDVEQMNQSLKHIHRVLRRGGSFVFSVPHPAFPFLHQAGRPFYFDIGAAGYFSSRDTTFPGRIWKRDGTALDVQLVHKTVQDYFDGLRAAGFGSMPTVLELKATAEMAELDRDFFEPILGIPLHMAFKVERS
jgi:SAM-dependent methyltransferase